MSQNRTLLFYINSLHRGGAQRVMVSLAGRFAAAGWHSVLVSSYREDDEYPLPEGVERVVIESERSRAGALRRNVSRIRALRGLLRQYRPAALISFMAEPNFRAVLAARGLPVKVIVSVRNDPEREYAGRLFRFVGQHILPLADGCVFQTAAQRDWFPEKLREKSAVIMNQADARFFDQCFREIPGFARERAIILGDSLTSDIRGGINAGIRTCWFNPKGKENPGPIIPDYEIDKLNEFEGLLERIFS